MSEAQARSFVRAPVVLDHEGQTFRGSIATFHRSVLGNWAFRATFVDGDATVFQSWELLSHLVWPQFQPQALQSESEPQQLAARPNPEQPLRRLSELERWTIDMERAGPRRAS